MQTIEIIIQRKFENTWPVIVEQEREGGLPVRSVGQLQLNLSDLETALYDISTYGTMLGQALFRENIRDAFVASLRESKGQLRVILSVEAGDLKKIHWERLCAPLDNRWSVLSADQRVPLSTYIPAQTDRWYPLIERQDLQALVVVAHPDDLTSNKLAEFDQQATIAGIKRSLGSIPYRVLASVDGADGKPTLEEISLQLTSNKYTILHLVCHGDYIPENDETILYLADAENKLVRVRGTQFLDRLSKLRGEAGLPQIIFLESCETAIPTADTALGGLAQRLVRELGTPAVIAMTDKISIPTAQALAEQFYVRLCAHGEVDLALVEACAGIAERFDITIPSLFSRLRNRPLFSTVMDRPLSEAELAFGLKRVAELAQERAPILEATLQSLSTPLVGRSPAAEKEKALAEIERLCHDTFEIDFRAIAQNQPAPTYNANCPFRGLAPFRPEDRIFFFGREKLVEQLHKRLDEYPFLCILGASGSGKSSLAMAGLIPVINKQEPNVKTLVFTPGNDPITQLETALTQIAGFPFLLVVDQFEEVFTNTPVDKRQGFLDRLFAVAKQGRLAITMRADFLGECAVYPQLREAVQAHQQIIPPMDESEMRQAMELQSQAVGLRFEPGLIALILDDVLDEPGAMPLLQHSLQELWKRRHGRWLRASEYQAIGRIQQAIAFTADSVFVALQTDEQVEVRNIFMRLVRVGEEINVALGRDDTRRRAPLEEVVASGADPAVVKNLIKRLADARLVVTNLNPATDLQDMEVAHEALIRFWPRLRGWINEDRQALLLRDRLRQDAAEWESHGQEDSYLVHRGRKLQEANSLPNHPRITLNESERAYLQACLRVEQKQNLWQADLAIEMRNLDVPTTARIIDIYLSRPGVSLLRGSRQADIQTTLELDPLALKSLEATPDAYSRALSQAFYASAEVKKIFEEAVKELEAAHDNEMEMELQLHFWLEPRFAGLHSILWEALLRPDLSFPLPGTKTRLLWNPDTSFRSWKELNGLLLADSDAAESRWGNIPTLPLGKLTVLRADVEEQQPLHARLTAGSDVLIIACDLKFADGNLWLAPVGPAGHGIDSDDFLEWLKNASRKPRLVVLEVNQRISTEPTGGSTGHSQMLNFMIDLAHCGAVATLCLPIQNGPVAMQETISTLFIELENRDGRMDLAGKEVLDLVKDSQEFILRSPVLYLCNDEGMIWYKAGFYERRTHNSSKTLRDLAKSLNMSRVTPVLGPALSASILGEPQAAAIDIASRNELTYVNVDSLSAVLEEVSIREDRYSSCQALIDYYTEHIRNLYAPLLPKDIKENREIPISNLIGLVGKRLRAANPDDPYAILAQLKVPIYVTLNQDNLLEDALLEAGKGPEQFILPWSDHFFIESSIFDREPGYVPSPERPLVAHFFGHFDVVDSLLLTESDFLEFQINVIRNRDSVPGALRQAFGGKGLMLVGHQPHDRAATSLPPVLAGNSGQLLRQRYSHVAQFKMERINEIEPVEMRMELQHNMKVYWGEVEDFLRALKSELSK